MKIKQIPPEIISGKTYFADEEGNIINSKGKKLKPGFSPAKTKHHLGSGKLYPLVNIAGKSRTIHFLVCSAFWGVRKPDHVCHHLDGNGQNNRPDNLIWVLRKNHPIFDRATRAGHIFVHDPRTTDEIMLFEMQHHMEL